MILAVETSGTQGSVAISDGKQLLTERPLSGGSRHAQTLVSEVDGLLREHHLSPSDIRAVAVSIGPGSFTGLRVGLVFAKTFAWLSQTALVAVDTLQAVAQQTPPDLEIVTAVVDAQRGELFAGSYLRDSASGFRTLIDTIHVSTQEALSTAYPLTGSGLQKLRPEVAANHHLLDQSLWHPRASTIARLGLQMVREGRLSAPETLEPVYIRLSYAEEKRDR